MRSFLILGLVLLAQSAMAAETRSAANLIGIGQGISSPTLTSTVNYSSGYTAESPLGTIYQNGARITGQYDKYDNDDALGAELGYGQGEWGLAAGYRKLNCDGCDGSAAGAAAIAVGDFGFGIRFGEDLYSGAFLLNPNGTHRFGLMAELNNGGGDNADITAYGVGYSYVDQQFTLTLDASSRSFEDSSINDDRILVTPGFMLRADIFQLSVNDRITINRNENDSSQNGKDHDFWFGLGLGGDTFHVAAYSDYVSEVSVVGSFFF